MSGDTAFREAVWDWLAYALSVTVYRAEQSGPDQYPDEFATYKIAFDESHPWPDVSVSKGHHGRVVTRHHFPTETMVSVNFYGAAGAELGLKLNRARFDWQARQKLAPVGAVAYAVSSVRDLAFLGGTEWRPRFQCDVSFRRSASADVGDYRVDSALASGAIDGESVTIAIETGRGRDPRPETYEEEG